MLVLLPVGFCFLGGMSNMFVEKLTFKYVKNGQIIKIQMCRQTTLIYLFDIFSPIQNSVTNKLQKKKQFLSLEIRGKKTFLIPERVLHDIFWKSKFKG